MFHSNSSIAVPVLLLLTLKARYNDSDSIFDSESIFHYKYIFLNIMGYKMILKTIINAHKNSVSFITTLTSSQYKKDQ